jgi:hypothetical protein
VPKTTGTSLPDDVRARMEPKLGADLSAVRVHTGPESAGAARGFGARAFTVGNDVHFGGGQFAPGTKEGDKLLAHELTHVVQGQKSGIQRSPVPGEEKKGGAEVSQPGDAKEVEADAVAEKVAGDEDGEEKEGSAAAKGGAAGGKPKAKAGAKDEEAAAEEEMKKKGEPFKVGTELWVQRSFPGGLFKYNHAGVYAGKGQVVHVNSTALKAIKRLWQGKEVAAVEQASVAEFAGGGTPVQGPSPHNFTPKERAKRAISHLGEQWKYDPMNHNCQHFASMQVSGGASSPEAQKIADSIPGGYQTSQSIRRGRAEKEQKKNDENFQEELKEEP